MTALNKADDFILAIITVDGEAAKSHYVRQSFERQCDFGVASVNCSLSDLPACAGKPRETEK